MSVFSNWWVQWDPAGANLTFLDFDQEMGAELSFPWEQDHVDRQVIEGNYTEPLPRMRVRGSLSFTAIKEHATDAAARDYIHTHRAAIHALRGLRKTLRITPLVTSAGAVNYANTMIKSVVPRIVVSEEAEPKTAVDYLFLGAW